MTHGLKKILAISVSAACLGMAAPVLAAGGSQDTAVDHRDNTLTNSWGNCVRTKWNADSDACAPAPKPEPVAAPAPPTPPAKSLINSREARTVYFNFNDESLTEESRAKLDSLAYAIRGAKNIERADIIGYADEMGNSDYNIALSERRSQAVEEYLSRLVNIPTAVEEVRGLGETNSVTDCSEETSRAKRISCLARDRRVEVEFKFKELK